MSTDADKTTLELVSGDLRRTIKRQPHLLGNIEATLRLLLRETEKGESFLITVEGRPIAMLTPYPKRRWVPRAEVLKLLATGKPDPRFFQDVAELGTLD